MRFAQLGLIKNRVTSGPRRLIRLGASHLSGDSRVWMLFGGCLVACVAIFLVTPALLPFDISLGITLVFTALLGGIVSSHAPTTKPHKIGYISVFVGLAVLSMWLVIKQSAQTAHESAELRDQIRQLVKSTSPHITPQDIQFLKDDISLLRSDTKSGFGSVVDAINSLRSNSSKLPVKPPTVTQAPPPRVAEQPSLGPGLVQHIQISQRRIASSKDSAPFALQVVIQTDTSTQPTAFMIECSGDIEDGSFFVAGQPAMMGVGWGVQPDKKHFYLKFQYPPFTPDSPVVVTLLSKTDIRIVAVNKAN